MARTMRGYSAFALCIVAIGCAQNEKAVKRDIHLLRWKWSESVQRFSLDGTDLGFGSNAILALERKLKPGDTLRVLRMQPLPADGYPSWGIPDDFHAHCMSSGVRVDFAYEDRWLQAHYLTWDEFDPFAPRAGQPVYIFNGRRLGRGEDGLSKLWATQLDGDSVIFVFNPLPDELSSPPSIWPQELEDMFFPWLRKIAARFGGELRAEKPPVVY